MFILDYLVDGVSRARRSARPFRRATSIDRTVGCAPPNTRRAVRSVSSSVVTASRWGIMANRGIAQRTYGRCILL